MSRKSITIHDVYNILPPSDVPAQQKLARQAATQVDFTACLDIKSRAARARLTGVICTIGPACNSPEMLYKMIKIGMNIARLNFSHGNHEYHSQTIINIRKAVKMFEQEQGYDPCVAIALDTKGPEIRTGLLEGDDGRKEVFLVKGETIKITTDDDYKLKCTEKILWVDYKNISKVLTPGKRIFIDDGLISVVVQEVGDNFILGEIENGGGLGSRKGCNLPGTETDLPAVSTKDIEDLKFGVEQDVDMIFASFIRDADGVRAIREVLGEKGENIKIVPKIENQEGVKNIDEIIAEANAIMVARGDMGIEIPPEKVFIAQKQIIAKCNKAAKGVICATQMLESMVKRPRPTRAEASDVANAVLDGADCVMLSGETAKGDYPLECIETMTSLAREAESCMWSERFFEDILRAHSISGITMDVTHTTAVSAVHAAYHIGAAAIICVTTTGQTVGFISKYRPQCPTIAVTRSVQVARQLHLHRGILPIYYAPRREDNWVKDVDNRIQCGLGFGIKKGFIHPGDPIVCITGWRQGAGSSNTIRILHVDAHGNL